MRNTNSIGNTMALNSYLLIITVNVKGLNVSIKRHRVSEWIKKKDPSIYYLQETDSRPKDTCRLKVRRWRTIYRAQGSQKKGRVAVLRSIKLDFKTKTIIRDEERHYIIIKASIY